MNTIISSFFKTTAPIAEVVPTSSMKQEKEFYFQLLADYGITLNEPQQEAVRAVDGPVLIIAGAGSGKTTVLTAKIGYMIHTKNIDPSKILLVTFTKKASVEMIERLARIPGLNRSASRAVTAGTYHSIFLNILRQEGYNFRVLSSERKRHYIIKTILRKMNRQDDYAPETILSVISSWKNNMIRPIDVDVNSDIKTELRYVYEQYEKIKADENLYDFDDMLLEVYYLFMFEPSILNKYQSQFEYVLCDEFQDSSKVQYEIIQMLTSAKKNLCIVGDDDQTIYGFRSASASYMIDFDKAYPNCRKVIMDINYRSNPDIVGLGNSIINVNKKRIKKTLKVVKPLGQQVNFLQPNDNEEEARNIVKEIKTKQAAGASLKDISILYRTHTTGRAIFEHLLLADIPFITYGRSNESFYENSFVRPLIDLMRLSVNPMDADALISAAPILYISKTEAEATIDEISIDGFDSKDLLGKVLKRIADKKSGFAQKSILKKIDCINSLAKMTAPRAIREIRLGAINYERHLELDQRKTLTVHKEYTLEMLDECEQAARGFDSPKSFLGFIERVKEKNDEMETLRSQPDIEAVRLMTIHASKGLEFKTVFVIGATEGILPHAAALESSKREDTDQNDQSAIEEERRLAYVAVTRAKEELYISSPRMNRNNTVKISRFILESMNVEGVDSFV
ncbi:ATP-dependent helicase [Cytobacillus purgationiresistens]|uniref:DNA 3'-5' helicase n=1 Tax=Cytobacillus purgationiresistens TaxID=863449 RepID=A0ABU0ASD6_9BACI|nr:ATP-dependent helicase [Cytobacillus purgationiresistens]MDQ0273348.1 DNA helicase-2/ATP-dependent DNA helicase PcrA [Cytobacillus purgationiresistens]